MSALAASCPYTKGSYRPQHAAYKRSHLLQKRHRCRCQLRGCRNIAAPVLPPIGDDQQLAAEAQWLSDTIQDDEWQVQENHRDLGVAVAKAYRAVRSRGENDIGAILLSIASDLEAFDFHDTFTGNFEVANKAVELLMSSDGQEVCCG